MKKEHSKLCPVSAGYTDCHCSGKLAPVIKKSLTTEKEWIDCKKCGDCVEVPKGRLTCYQCNP